MLESLPLLRALRHPWSTMTAAHHTADVWSHAIKWVQAISGQTAWNMHDGANKQTVETRVGRWLCPPSHLQKAGLAFVLHFLALLRSSANHPAGVIIPAFYWRRQEMDWGTHPTGDEGHCSSQSPMMCCHVFGGDTWVWLLYGKVSSRRSFGRCLLFRLKVGNAIIQVWKYVFRGKWPAIFTPAPSSSQRGLFQLWFWSMSVQCFGFVLHYHILHRQYEGWVNIA